METALYENKLISFKSKFATLGGTNDIGRGLPPEGRDNLSRAIQRNQVVQLSGDDMNENIELRMSAYQNEIPQNIKYKAFIILVPEWEMSDH
jgi:poly-gamma-glutamate system protein